MTVTQTLTIQERMTWKDDSVDPSDDGNFPPIKFDFALDGGATYVEEGSTLELNDTGQGPNGSDIVTKQFLLVRSLRGTVYVDFQPQETIPVTYKTIMHVRVGEQYMVRLAPGELGMNIKFKAPTGETARVRYWLLGKTT